MLGVVLQFLEQAATLERIKFHDLLGSVKVNEQCFAASNRVRAHQWVSDLNELVSFAARSPSRRKRVVVVVSIENVLSSNLLTGCRIQKIERCLSRLFAVFVGEHVSGVDCLAAVAVLVPVAGFGSGNRVVDRTEQFRDLFELLFLKTSIESQTHHTC